MKTLTFEEKLELSPQKILPERRIKSKPLSFVEQWSIRPENSDPSLKGLTRILDPVEFARLRKAGISVRDFLGR